MQDIMCAERGLHGRHHFTHKEVVLCDKIRF